MHASEDKAAALAQGELDVVEVARPGGREERDLARIPLLTPALLRGGRLPPNSLVRYRGMVQDMFDPEFYVDDFIEVCRTTGARRAGRARLFDPPGSAARVAPRVRAQTPHARRVVRVSRGRDGPRSAGGGRRAAEAGRGRRGAGPVDRIAKRFKAWEDSGLTGLTISGDANAIRTMAEIARLNFPQD